MYRRRLNGVLPTVSTSKQNNPAFNNLLNQQYESLSFSSFLSPTSTRLLLDTHHHHLRAVAELAFGTPASITQAERDLFRIIEAAERDEGKLRNPRLLHHASQAWNLEFFLRGLVQGHVTAKEITPPEFVLNILSREFGSFEAFKRTFQAHASAMIGCGWVWLVKTTAATTDKASKLKVLTTFNGASPLFKSDTMHNTFSNPTNTTTSAASNTSNTHVSTVKNSPILGLNLWESAFILDYALDRDAYVKNWWNVINWNVASVLLSK